MALLYAVQAATGNPGLAYLPVAAYLTQQMNFSAAQLAGFQAMVLLPWVTKPLWALLIDGLARLGYTTKTYLVLCFGGMVLGFGLLSQVQQPTAGRLLVALGLLSVAVAIADVVADRWMVIEGLRHQRGNVYQAAQWVGWGSTAMTMFLVGGWLADRIPLHQVFGLSAVVPALALLLVAWKLPEVKENRPQPKSQGSSVDSLQFVNRGAKNPRIWADCVKALRRADLRRVLGLVVLLHLSPLPIDYLYQVQELGFENSLVGQLKAMESVGTALGALGFGLWAWRSARLPWLSLAVIGQAGAMLSLVGLSGAASAYGVYLLRGMFAIVSFLGLFGQVVAVCPPQVAGSAYALVISPLT
ncbi:MFS transporter [Leptolyngbya sp. CCNP1308]|uniref:MFS transporter n=1 Tax=Leptolyngbya sp. CCNP1308 TaxID=3110255 RepID=UPI002B1ECC03|nr:MFS transporter [Leptolyngbya sp. CCNP1308]MEA5448377.1 MFS transporter [Leptolyngbya sp. CCNP1308]